MVVRSRPLTRGVVFLPGWANPKCLADILVCITTSAICKHRNLLPKGRTPNFRPQNLIETDTT